MENRFEYLFTAYTRFVLRFLFLFLVFMVSVWAFVCGVFYLLGYELF